MFRLLVILIAVSVAYSCSPKNNRTLLPEKYNNAEAYEAKRRLLVKQDSALAFDAAIVLDAEEEKANIRLKDLQTSMINSYNLTQFFPPSKHFFKSADHIYSTPLFALLKQMPKGAVHHLHPSAGVSFRWIVDRAVEEKDCYVFWNDTSKIYLKGEIHFFAPGKAPTGFISAVELNKSQQNFKAELFDLLAFDNKMMADSVDIWKEFEYRFRRIDGFNSYQPLAVDFYTSLFDSLAADGVQHVELRTHLSDNLYDFAHPNGYFNGDSVVSYIRQAVARIKARRDADFSCTLIYTNVRFQPVATIKSDLVRAFDLRKKYPDLIKAYDLVAYEDAGNSTRFYLDAWLGVDSLTKVFGIDLPFCFHDGESDWQHLTNVYDAVLLKTKRLGHGFNMSFFPSVEAEIIRSKTCVEVSPLSNQILGYITDLRMHPAHTWIKRGVQISINPDDPSIFRYSGVTPDYWAIFLAWELDLRSLKQLALNSINYSLLEKSEKEVALQAWNKKWRSFITMLNNDRQR